MYKKTYAPWDNHLVSSMNPKKYFRRLTKSKNIHLLALYLAINSVAVSLQSNQQSIWPQMDNLAGVNSNITDTKADYYTGSLFSSPRVISVFLIKIISSLFFVDGISAIITVGTLVMNIGPPLFLLAVRKRISPDRVSGISIADILIAIVFFTLLNSINLHKFEVNGFFINPFLQGATTSNIASILFLVGFLIPRSKCKSTLIALSIVCHLTTGLFMYAIFASPFKILKLSVSRKIYLLVLFVIGALGVKYITNELEAWSYYVRYRAANHYIISTSNEKLLELAILISLIGYLVSMLRNSLKCTLISGLVASILIAITSYPYYALPFCLAVLSATLSRNATNINRPFILLLFLFGMQNIPVREIAIPFSILMPATRVMSLLCLYFICLISIDGTTRLRREPHDSCSILKLSNKKSGALIVCVSLFAVGQQLVSADVKTQYEQLEIKVNREFPPNLAKADQILAIGLDTVGWREVKRANIFVDEYPFWGNLREYAKRSKFKSEVEKLMQDLKMNPRSLYEVRTKYKIFEPIILIVEIQNRKQLQGINCLSRAGFFVCKLEESNVYKS